MGGGQRYCASCRDRVGVLDFPYRRDQWDIGELFGYAWHTFTENWLMLIAANVVVILIVFGVSFVVSLPIELVAAEMGDAGGALSGLVQIFTTLLQGVLQLGLYALYFDALTRRSASLERVFSQWRKVGSLILQYLAVALVFLVCLVPVGLGYFAVFELFEGTAKWVAVTIWTLVILVPLVYLILGFAFIEYELALDDEVGGLDAARRAWSLMRGQRLWALLLFVLVVLVNMAGLIALCVGLLVTVPFTGLLLAAFYLAIRNGSGMPAPVRTSPAGFTPY